MPKFTQPRIAGCYGVGVAPRTSTSDALECRPHGMHVQSSSQDWARASSTGESTAALTPSKTTQRSLVGGAEQHLEVESLCFLDAIDHLEKIASLRIAAGDRACASQ